MELALYNGALSGLALDGEHFFYDNPLASRGEHRRWTWHRCPCCPPNIGRLIASLGQYVYSIGPDEAAVHLYVEGRARLRVAGVEVELQQATRYPWDGSVELRVEPQEPVAFALRLRVPAWCRSARLEINGSPIDIELLLDRGYAHIRRRWERRDVVGLSLAMPVERIYAHPEVTADAGRVALKRGPIVYCVEGGDADAPVHRIALPRASAIEAGFDQDLLSGVGTLHADAVAAEPGENAPLYRTEASGTRPVRLRAIPYSFWSNRDAGEMSVWLREV
jgi:DUF1680 family protein